jgi:hypothetical protein
MIGMGAVVAGDVPPHALAFGSPARVHGWVCVCGTPVVRGEADGNGNGNGNGSDSPAVAVAAGAIGWAARIAPAPAARGGVIDVLADDGRSAFGLAAALDGERVPWRRIRRAEEFDARALIVATRALDASAAALLRRVPSLVLGVPQGLPPDLFGHTACSVVDEPIRLAIDGSILAADVRARAMQFRVRHLRLPRAPRGVLAGRPHGTVLGVGGVADGAMLPVVVQVAGAPCTWSLVDLGAALADLMDEGYRPIESVAARPIPRLVLATYYRMPERSAASSSAVPIAASRPRSRPSASGLGLSRRRQRLALGEMLLALVRRTAGTSCASHAGRRRWTQRRPHARHRAVSLRLPARAAAAPRAADGAAHIRRPSASWRAPPAPPRRRGWRRSRARDRVPRPRASRRDPGRDARRDRARPRRCAAERRDDARTPGRRLS